MTEKGNDKNGDAANQNPPIVLHAQAHDVNGTVEWGLGFHPAPPAKFKVNLDLARRSGGHKVIIHLAGNTNNIRFNQADPIWVCETGACPPPKGSKSTQIEDIQCNANMLTFFDRNAGQECVLTYQLNFIGADPLDPMIRNGGF